MARVAAMVRRAVVLAAGDGGRLGPHTLELPKALVPVDGRPLVHYTLDALAQAGIGEAVVVTGYRGEQLRVALADGGAAPRLRFVANPDFRRGASLSLRAARAHAGTEPFLLAMADHLLSPALIHSLIAADDGLRSAVAADYRPASHHDIEEATRLRVDRRQMPVRPAIVTAIGKQVEPFDALDAGAFLVQPSIWRAVDDAAQDCELSDIFAGLVRQGLLVAADVSGSFWFDVDTAGDLALAEELVRGRLERGVA